MTDETENSEVLQDDAEEFIPEDGEGNTGTPKDIAKDLRAKLKKALEEKAEYLAELQRAKADFINLRKRDEEEKKELTKFVTLGLVEELVPVLESFDMARGNTEAWEKVDPNWRKGVEYINDQLVSVLEGRGVKVIDPKGEIFDPARHEAIAHKPVTNQNDDHKVITVLQKGYELSGRVIKPARVEVGEWKA